MKSDLEYSWMCITLQFIDWEGTRLPADRHRNGVGTIKPSALFEVVKRGGMTRMFAVRESKLRDGP